MAVGEKETVFSSKVAYAGLFSFADFYKFCHDWLVDEAGLKVVENKYSEKLVGDSKDIDVDWTASKKVTDYFKYEVKVGFKINGLKKVEIMQGNTKVETNSGKIKITVKGTLIRDYKGKFEISAFKKFLRGIYEKWVITSRIDQMEEKLANMADEFLLQAKAYLALEGRKG